MRIKIEPASTSGIAKYPRLERLFVTEFEEDFIGESVTLICRDPVDLEERDKFLTWCDKHDQLAVCEASDE